MDKFYHTDMKSRRLEIYDIFLKAGVTLKIYNQLNIHIIYYPTSKSLIYLFFNFRLRRIKN